MRSIYVILVVLVNTFAFSQKIYEGKVLDSHQFPISYADVVAIDSGDRMIESSMTDQEGNFKIKINEQDSIRIEISFVGFQTKVIFPSSANVGTVILKEQATELKEIAVVARKKLVEQKVDRLVFNASNSVASSNGNALDLLKVTPGVQIDQKNVIRMIGKSAVRVLINDKMVQMSGEELTNYLEGISSDDIEKIEVITMPPSKYEAEGNSGLINIILKKAKENSWSNQTRATYIQKTYPTAVLGNTFNFLKNNQN